MPVSVLTEQQRTRYGRFAGELSQRLEAARARLVALRRQEDAAG